MTLTSGTVTPKSKEFFSAIQDGCVDLVWGGYINVFLAQFTILTLIFDPVTFEVKTPIRYCVIDRKRKAISIPSPLRGLA